MNSLPSVLKVIYESLAGICYPVIPSLPVLGADTDWLNEPLLPQCMAAAMNLANFQQ